MSDIYTPIRERIERALRDREPVIVYENDEAGVLQWSVSLISDPGFWLDSFPERAQAEAFCQEHELPVQAVSARTHPSMDYEDVIESLTDETPLE